MISSRFLLILMIGLFGGSGTALSAEKKADDFAEKIRSFGKNGEIDEKKTAVAEVLITRNEKRALDQINTLIRKYKNTALEPGLQFRKAELIVRQAKSARFFEFSKAQDDKVMTMVPPELRSSNSISKLQEAIRIYDDIERRFSAYEDLDMVLFNNAFLRQQVGEKQKPKDIYYSLIKRFPNSDLVPDTYLAVAEMNYDQKMWKEALKDYEAIKAYPDSRVYPYGLYKTAWTKYQLKDAQGAINELENTITVSVKRQESAGDTKYNLKEEALGDLVLFYSEKGDPDKGFQYFLKWAGKELVGKYILQLAGIYERHGQHKEREFVLQDFIDNVPESTQAPRAYRDLVLNDLFLKRDPQAFKHIVAFEDHCSKYYKDENAKRIAAGKSQKEEDLEDEESSDMDARPNCNYHLAKMSYKLSKKWHDDWKKSKNKDVAEQADRTYRIYIAAQIDATKRETVRFSYAEFNFQREFFKTAMEQYELVSKSITDKQMLHDSSYFAIVSLEKYVNGKWSDRDEDKYIQLATTYITKNPTGKFITDVKFKRSFIAYEKKRYAEALPGFRDIGWKLPKTDLGLKAQDLYLDILNIQKDFASLMTATQELLKLSPDEKRKGELTNLYRESFFSKAQKLQEDKSYAEALVDYEKFALENKGSKLADSAFFNIIQIHLAQKNFKRAADKSYELAINFPNSKHAIDSLKKSAEIYEHLARPELVGDSLFELSKLDEKESKKWQVMAIDFYVVGNQTEKAKRILAKFVAQGDYGLVKDQVIRYADMGERIGLDKKTLAKISDKLGLEADAAQDGVDNAEKAFSQKQYADAFKAASRVLNMSRKEVPNTLMARARLVQSRILEMELKNQSMKSKLDRLQTVLTLKTEKLDKAQRAFQETMKFGDPSTTIQAFQGLVRCFDGFVNDLKNIQFTEAVNPNDEKIIRTELEKMILPLEDRILDTLKEGMEFAQKAKLFNGQIQDLRNEMNKMNMKLSRIVAYKPNDPGISVVQ